jgi:hypothetical protein
VWARRRGAAIRPSAGAISTSDPATPEESDAEARTGY